MKEKYIVNIIKSKGDCRKADIPCKECDFRLDTHKEIFRDCYLVKNYIHLDGNPKLFDEVYEEALKKYMETHSKEDLVEILL